MGGWDAIAASVSGMNPAAYGIQRGRVYRPVVKPTDYTDETLITVAVLESKTLHAQQALNDASSLATPSTKKQADVIARTNHCQDSSAANLRVLIPAQSPTSTSPCARYLIANTASTA